MAGIGSSSRFIVPDLTFELASRLGLSLADVIRALICVVEIWSQLIGCNHYGVNAMGVPTVTVGHFRHASCVLSANRT